MSGVCHEATDWAESESFSVLPTHQLGFLEDSVGSHMVSSEKDPPLLQTQHSLLWSGKSISAVL